jgi:hypothetical protein
VFQIGQSLEPIEVDVEVEPFLRASPVVPSVQRRRLFAAVALRALDATGACRAVRLREGGSGHDERSGEHDAAHV